jgi:hypothetical protein
LACPLPKVYWKSSANISKFKNFSKSFQHLGFNDEDISCGSILHIGGLVFDVAENMVSRHEFAEYGIIVIEVGGTTPLGIAFFIDFGNFSEEFV